MNKVWNVAIYARVSTDKKEQSESIPVQVENLKKWLLEKSKTDTDAIYNMVDIYEDNGKSGSNFDRDEFIRMKNDIENKKINMVITRDLSRFSRNYIMAGYYLEDYFKVNNIRFISVLDNVDTISEYNDIIPFKNILNEMYIKDCSRKVKSALNTRMQNGSSIASKPPYGYKFDEVYEGNQKKIVLIPRLDDTTEVVKEIYSLYLNGWGAGKIATYLNNKKIPTPSQNIKNFARAKFGKWNNNTIMSILRNPKYGGYMVQGRYKKPSYKSKKIILASRDEWVYGGEFDGIVSKEVFDKVQEVMNIRSSKNYRYKNGVIHPFSTVLVCGGCKGSMTYRGKYEGYKCVNSQMGGKRCTPHSIKEKDLIEIVSINLKELISKYIDEKSICDGYDKIQIFDNSQNQLDGIEEKITRLNIKFKKLYEDKIDGIISEYNFSNMIESLQMEQEQLLKKREKFIRLINNKSIKNDLLSEYKGQLKQLLNGECIDRKLIESLVDKIVINEVGGNREKEVNIYFKFSN